jgi:hypothetical protein
MQGEHPRLCAETCKQQSPRQIQRRFVRHLKKDLVKLCKVQRADAVLQYQHPHKLYKPAAYGNGKVGLPGTERLGSFVVYHHRVRAKGHNLKKEKRGKEIGGKKHPHHRAEREQIKEPVTVCFF